MFLQDGGTVQSSYRAAPAGCPDPRLMIVNLWRYRLFIVKNALSDVRAQYAGSVASAPSESAEPAAAPRVASALGAASRGESASRTSQSRRGPGSSSACMSSRTISA